MLTTLLCLTQMLWLRLRHEQRGGPTTETVIITAALAGLALVVTAIIVARVTAKANTIDLGP